MRFARNVMIRQGVKGFETVNRCILATSTHVKRIYLKNQ